MKNLFSTGATSALLAAGFLCFGLQSARAAFIPIAQTDYFQNFDSLEKSGKGKNNKTLPSGWAIAESGDEDSGYRADNGSLKAGGMYSYGANGSTDRALGSLRQGGGNGPQSGNFGVFGANFQNTSGSAVARLNISYTGEEWRLGADGRGPDRLQFQYSLNASSLTSGTWINAPSLNFLTPNLTGVGAHDGNLAVNQTQIAGSIGFLNIPVGGTFWVRWVDANLPGHESEDGLAIDNFSITAIPEAATLAAGFGMSLLLSYVLLKHGAFRRPKVAARGT